jgi:hypothetical protein
LDYPVEESVISGIMKKSQFYIQYLSNNALCS